ncbi:uncharacterized protein N7506_008523 [Penicillium brevicompactum]|uniref:uncharacterized protein n=1 Tax=Penicillium brevicompactum TaxID=5074 RepID=UPI0025401946|nr:uncharacterized protein N7506_008523 [Penicillium brevicompactum]KAJ5325421.1 hypothetical protein N7506_008523 [Penicillium brevicompactum]
MNPLNTLVRGDMDAKRLDAVGSSLWNACTQMLAVRGKTDEDIQALSKARTAAFVLLNLAVPPTMLGWLRSLGVSLIAAQTCIVAKQLNAAYNILGVSGERLQAVQPSHLGLDLTLNYSLTTKYWLLRIRLAAECQQFDLAEHLWTKVPSPFLMGDCGFVLETTFLVGESALVINPPVAIKWLHKSFETLHNLYVATGQGFVGFEDWDLAIRHSLVVACLPMLTPDSAQILCIELANLQQSYPSQPAVMLLGLIARTTLPTIEELVQTFKMVVAQTPMTNANMGMIFQFIHFMGKRSQHAAFEALAALLLVELPREWTEKCFLGYLVLMTRCNPMDPNHIRTTSIMMQSLEHRGFPSFGPKTARAAVACLWKLIGIAVSAGDYSAAISWLHICGDHKNLHDCDKETQYAISRKLFACYVQVGNVKSAREFLNRGFLVSRLDCKKMYFEYKLAMLEGQNLSNFFCLGFPSQPVLEKQTALLACAMEAQRQKKHAEAMNCLAQLTKCTGFSNIYNPVFSVAEHHMFLICLVINEMETYRPMDFYRRAEEVLANALEFAKSLGSPTEGAPVISITELQWLYQASYRVALKAIEHRQLDLALQALKHSHEFTIVYRRAAGIEGRMKAPRPHFFLINFLRILIYVDAARKTNDEAEKVAHYTNVRASFKALAGLFGWEDGLEDSDRELSLNETDQYGLGKFFNFEATYQLGLWSEIKELCEDNHRFPTSQFYSQMTEWIFHEKTPCQVQIKFLKRVIYEIINLIDQKSAGYFHWSMELPRYLYCLFLTCTSFKPANLQLGVEEEMIDFRLADRVLCHIYTIAKREASKPDDVNNGPNVQTFRYETGVYIVGGKNPFPAMELEHVARTTFNAAMRFNAGPHGETSMLWARRARDLAHLVPGGEELVKELQGHLQILAHRSEAAQVESSSAADKQGADTS